MKLIRLVTGEEIIAKISDDVFEQKSITIEEAILLIPAGEGKIGMVPFMPYSDGSPITISMDHVMFVTQPNEDLYRQVLKITTGIETPAAGLSIIT